MKNSITNIGFTGTQIGMTEQQKATVSKLITALNPYCVHHGDCIGADKDFHEIALSHGIDVFIHPPSNESKRAFCHPGFRFLPKPYLERNRDIVDETGILIATPKNSLEELRSGTWSTIRYAQKRYKAIIIVMPDGSTKQEGMRFLVPI